MKGNNQKSAYVLLGVLSIMIIGLSIAFAALSSTLNITFGNVTQSAESWNIAFKTGTGVAGTAKGTSTTGRTCGTANITATTATIADTTLSKPGDSCTWPLTVENKGTIDATLATITPTAPTSVTCTNSGASMVCGNITYKITTDENAATLLKTGGKLAKSGTQQIYLTATYTGSTLSATKVVQSGAKFSLVYNQA